MKEKRKAVLKLHTHKEVIPILQGGIVKGYAVLLLTFFEIICSENRADRTHV